jgi:Arc/MetJ family transcription regulator
MRTNIDIDDRLMRDAMRERRAYEAARWSRTRCVF